jgi:peptide/nickel transport system substrate-binding protein
LLLVGARGAVPPAVADPNATFDQDAWQLQAMTNDGLLAARKVGGAAGAELVPDLAATMPVASNAGKTWTFRLRSGLLYSTGQQVKASDVRASFERLFRMMRLSSETRALPPLGILGEDKCRALPRACDLSKGILVDNRTGTVVVRLIHPQPDFLQRLATPPFFVLPAGTPARPLTRPPFPATGPYEVVRKTPHEVDLARNPSFRVWSAQAQPPGYPDQIKWLLRVRPDQGLADVLAGRADVLDSSAAPHDADLLQTRYPALLHSDPVPATETIFLNASREPFSNLAVRQAVALATNRRRLANDEGPAATMPVTCQVLPPGLPGYRPFCPYTKNPGRAGSWSGVDIARARALIQRARVRRTKIVLAAPSDRPAVLRLIRDFSVTLRNLGLHPHIVTRPTHRTSKSQNYFSFIAEPDTPVQAGWFHWLVDRPDPSEFFDGVFDCRSAKQRPSLITGNVSHDCDPSIDTKIATAQRLRNGNPAAGAQSWAAIDAAVTRSAVWIPFANPRDLDVTSQRISGYAFNPLYSILLDQMSVR